MQATFEEIRLHALLSLFNIPLFIYEPLPPCTLSHSVPLSLSLCSFAPHSAPGCQCVYRPLDRGLFWRLRKCYASFVAFTAPKRSFGVGALLQTVRTDTQRLDCKNNKRENLIIITGRAVFLFRLG